MQTIGGLIATRLSSDPLLITVLAILVVVLVQILLLSRRIARLTRGKSGASLEATITELGATTAALSAHAQATETALNNLNERMESAVRAIVVRRFDPFENAGGQQSFATALLDERGDGVVLSGIHARDSVRVYAKDVHHFVSERELSADEVTAIADAKKRLH